MQWQELLRGRNVTQHVEDIHMDSPAGSSFWWPPMHGCALQMQCNRRHYCDFRANVHCSETPTEIARLQKITQMYDFSLKAFPSEFMHFIRLFLFCSRCLSFCPPLFVFLTLITLKLFELKSHRSSGFLLRFINLNLNTNNYFNLLCLLLFAFVIFSQIRP